ncbi:DUF3459 domain-containing protein [Kovacikia minuta CCNUW1]|uniref:alpha-amylase family glycosyl hydrolase n=1 Tax=Kovacikia minuta TaxID=2931930 RepID=UPI001CCB643A|nr:DUF3459 domain-containing protein [Kovacikia minuta CCNUW1]
MEFKLFAPYNEAAALVGSFSDWQAVPMQKGEDGYFRVTLDLEDGIYQYKLRVQSRSWFLKPDEWVEINDPYMTEMDLASENGIVHVKAGQQIRDTYVWKHDDKPLPANAELVMYELHIADFVGGEAEEPDKFARAIEKLDYLVELGVNAIELMPITEYAGNYRWGYMVRYYFAPESSYGSPEDLKRLIDECHARGIRVVIDAIYNHTDDQSPLLLIDRDYWYYHDRHYPGDDANYWGPEFNYEVYDEKLDIRPAWKFIAEVTCYWIQEYHIDGIRYDAVRQLANYDFFRWLIQEANQVVGKKPFYHIAEHIPDTSDIVLPDGPFEGCWHESFHYLLRGALLAEPIEFRDLRTAIAAQQQGYPQTSSVINYVATHDQEHLLVELGDRGIFGQPALQRVKLAVTLQMTAPGIPLLWMGDEFGQNTHKTQTVSEPNPLDWSLLKQDWNRDLFQFYQHLIALRKQTPALLTENIEFFHENQESQVLVYTRWNDTGSRVVVIANLSDEPMPGYTLSNFPCNGIWHEWVKSTDVEIGSDRPTIGLDKWEAKALILREG